MVLRGIFHFAILICLHSFYLCSRDARSELNYSESSHFLPRADVRVVPTSLWSSSKQWDKDKKHPLPNRGSWTKRNACNIPSDAYALHFLRLCSTDCSFDLRQEYLFVRVKRSINFGKYYRMFLPFSSLPSNVLVFLYFVGFFNIFPLTLAFLNSFWNHIFTFSVIKCKSNILLYIISILLYPYVNENST